MTSEEHATQLDNAIARIAELEAAIRWLWDYLENTDAHIAGLDYPDIIHTVGTRRGFDDREC